MANVTERREMLHVLSQSRNHANSPVCLVRDKREWLTEWIFQNEGDRTMCTFQGKGATRDQASI